MMAAEVKVVHELVATDLIRRAFDDDPAVVHHRDVAGDGERDAQSSAVAALLGSLPRAFWGLRS